MNQLPNNSLIENFLSQNEINYISPLNFLINLILTILLSLLVAYIYTKYGKNISNRKEFSSNFSFLSLTTMLIITIVKSSLALSLGLVGALSIVRFRTAIKDPEELNYLFLSIAIGLGIGANQILITVIATLFILLFTFLRRKTNFKSKEQFINLIITLPENSNNSFDEIIETISKFSNYISLKRFSKDGNNIESSLYLNIKSFSVMNDLRNNLTNNFPGIMLDFIDNSDLE